MHKHVPYLNTSIILYIRNDIIFVSIENKFDKWFENNSDIIDCSERGINEQRTVFHHCFLPREIVTQKGFNTAIVDFLDTISEDQVRWYCANENLGMSRLLMLQNLKRLNGVALFVGEIKDGVKEEYELATQLGIECIVIE